MLTASTRFAIPAGLLSRNTKATNEHLVLRFLFNARSIAKLIRMPQMKKLAGDASKLVENRSTAK